MMRAPLTERQSAEMDKALDAAEREWLRWHQARVAKGGPDGESSRRILEARNLPTK